MKYLRYTRFVPFSLSNSCSIKHWTTPISSPWHLWLKITLFLRYCILTMLTDSESTVILVLGRFSMYIIDLTFYIGLLNWIMKEPSDEITFLGLFSFFVHVKCVNFCSKEVRNFSGFNSLSVLARRLSAWVVCFVTWVIDFWFCKMLVMKSHSLDFNAGYVVFLHVIL
jgi:hypothetical protein